MNDKPEGVKRLTGDESDLFERYSAGLLRAVRREVWLSAATIEDACAFAWFELVRLQPERDRVFAWLRVVAIHEALRIAQRDKRRSELEAKSAEAAGGPGHETRQELRELLREVIEQAGGMPQKRRQVFALHLSGHTYDEIARRIGITPRSVERHILKARRQLRERFSAELSDGASRESR